MSEKKWNDWTFEDYWAECEFMDGMVEAESCWDCQQVVIDRQAKKIDQIEEMVNDLPAYKIASDGMLLVPVDKYNKLIDILVSS